MIPEKERQHLRELAKKQAELAKRDINSERERLWYAHNSLAGERPMVLMEDISFWDKICPSLVCESPLARKAENQLLKNIVIVDLLDDDKVIPDYYPLEFEVESQRYGVGRKKIYASDGIGFHIEPVIEIIEDDFQKLSFSEFLYHPQKIEQEKKELEEIFGDILPIVPINITNNWCMTLTQQAVELMGTENMFCAMIDEPDEFHRLMKFIADDSIRLLRYQEEVGCLQLNNRNNYLGSGSYCFNNELPQKDFAGKVRSIDTWGHLNSQESVGLSLAMYREFVIPETKRVAEEFGLVYYGCCEPVSDFWEGGVDQIANLRKVSVSAWCDEAYIAPRLADRNIIYSRKPSPNFIGIEKNFDEVEFRKYIKKSVDILRANNCKAEFIFRDIYDLHGNIEKVKRAVEITREESEKAY